MGGDSGAGGGVGGWMGVMGGCRVVTVPQMIGEAVVVQDNDVPREDYCLNSIGVQETRTN